MVWVRFDDATAEHPKVLSVGPLAELLWRRSVEYAARNLTDGRIPYRMVPLLVNWDGVMVLPEDSREPRDVSAYQLADELCLVNLWEQSGGPDDDYQIHDYLEYQPSREQVLAQRTAAKQRMQRVRSHRSQEVQANNRRSSQEVRLTPYPIPYLVPPSSLVEEKNLEKQETQVVLGTGESMGGGNSFSPPVGPPAAANPGGDTPPQRPPPRPRQDQPLSSLSEGALAVLQERRKCFGKKVLGKLNPTQQRHLEDAVVELGSERLMESCEWGASHDVYDIEKIIRASRSKRKRDETPSPQPPSPKRALRSSDFGQQREGQEELVAQWARHGLAQKAGDMT